MRRFAVLAIVLALPAGVLAHELLRSPAPVAPAAAVKTATGTQPKRSAPPRAAALVAVVRRIGSLPAAVQDAAVAALDGRVYAFGGLDASQVSVASVTTVLTAAARTGAQLPVAIHD